MRVEYTANNSGGSWWLKDDDWFALEKAGWKVEWVKDQTDLIVSGSLDGRWLGALAKEASREGLSLGDAIEEWERITGQNSNDLGCHCCGCPHSFRLYDGDKEIESYYPSSPRVGARYR